jgi:glycolate oxidase iron-sulfur subunit
VSVAEHADLRVLGGFYGDDVPESDLLRACVHCGMCLASCPTYRITGQEMSSPRGRLWMMNAVAEGRMELLDPVFDEQMYQCLNCRACEAVCPSGVKYGPLVEASRAQLEQHRHRPTWQRAGRKVSLGWLFAEAGRMRAFVGGIRLYQRSGLSWLARKTKIVNLLGMRDLEAMLPPVSKKFLIPGKESWTPKQTARSVQLFNGCMMGTVFADVNRATSRVLAHNHTAVTVPVGQQCCGALQVHSGQMEEARTLARRNIDSFESSGAEAIIINAAGCGAALKEYDHLLKDDPAYHDRAIAFSARVKDVSEFLGDLDFVKPTKKVDRVVTYQEPCHLAHAQRITAQPRKLLGQVDGLQLVEMRESSLCCGSAGIYNLIRRQMADELGDRKAENAIATGAVDVITANPGCAMQLRTSLARNGSTARVRHIVEVLDEAYGGAANDPTR